MCQERQCGPSWVFRASQRGGGPKGQMVMGAVGIGKGVPGDAAGRTWMHDMYRVECKQPPTRKAMGGDRTQQSILLGTTLSLNALP